MASPAGDGLDLELIQLKMSAHDLLDGPEGRFDGAVPHGEALYGDGAPVHLFQDDVGGGPDQVAVVDHIAL